MGSKFTEFLEEIEAEARAEGPEAVAELAQFDQRYRLAQQVMSRRRKLRLTQAELARRSGVGQVEISRIERGRSNPTFETLSALAAALGCDLALRPSDGQPGAVLPESNADSVVSAAHPVL